MQIRHLEEALGFPLFERNGRQVVLSDAGRAIYRCSMEVSGHFTELDRLAEQYKTADRGRINIAAPTTTEYMLPEMFARFQAGKPNIFLTLRLGNGTEVLRDLEENLVDFAIVGPLESRGDIVMEPLFDIAFVVVASRDYPVRSRGHLPIGVLGREPFIVREAISSGRTAIERFLAMHEVNPAIRMSLASDEAIKNAVRSGAGIAVLPLPAVQLELRMGELQVLQVEHFPLIRPWHIAMRRGKTLSSLGEMFRGYLQQEMPRYGRELLASAGATRRSPARGAAKPTSRRPAKTRASWRPR